MRTVRFFLVFLTALAAVSCTIQVNFDQTIDISLDEVSGQPPRPVTVRRGVSEKEIIAGLSKADYALTEFDSIVLMSATIQLVSPDASRDINSLKVSFFNDSQTNCVFAKEGSNICSGYNSLTLYGDDLLSLYRGKSFFIDLTAVRNPSPALTFRLHLSGQMIKTIP